VTISAVRGVAGELPPGAGDNTAGRALLAMQQSAAPGVWLHAEIDKGIPLGSGLGLRGLAVAAVGGGNALCRKRAACSSCWGSPWQAKRWRVAPRHVDNIAPSLYGGLVLTVGIDHPRVKQIPVRPRSAP